MRQQRMELTEVQAHGTEQSSVPVCVCVKDPNANCLHKAVLDKDI